MNTLSTTRTRTGDPNKVQLAIPKGSLEEPTLQLFQDAGFPFRVSDRGSKCETDDPDLEVLLLRPQEIPRYIAKNDPGSMDLGITGWDWITECGVQGDIEELGNFQYSKRSSKPTRWVLAVPEESSMQQPEDLRGGRIATEIINTTRRWFQERGIPITLEFSCGATEAKPGRFVDAIVDATETGASLKANRLRELGTIIESTPRLIVNPLALKNDRKREKIEDIALMLQSVIEAHTRVMLICNVGRKKLEQVLAILPSLGSPTIAGLANKKGFAVNTVVDERASHLLIPQLKRAGATDIIQSSIARIIR